MTALDMTTVRKNQRAIAAPGFDRWRHERIIEARRILAEAPRHRGTLVALAARVLADLPQTGGAA